MVGQFAHLDYNPAVRIYRQTFFLCIGSHGWRIIAFLKVNLAEDLNEEAPVGSAAVACMCRITGIRDSPPSSTQQATEQKSSVKVWANTKSHVYHCPGTRWYGATKNGTYMSEDQAQQQGYRPAYGKPCGGTSSPSTPATEKEKPAPSQGQHSGAADVKVWVNTSSGVYHCPGTRWYGATKAGEYMPQSQAQDKGYRPAYGKVCK